MSQKTPIKPKDIRKGDLIRWERPKGYNGSLDVAGEYYARHNSFDPEGVPGCTYFLLDRPETYVKVPQSAIDRLAKYALMEDAFGDHYYYTGPGAESSRELLAAIDYQKETV